MRRSRCTLAFAAGVVGLLAAATPAAAQNLLTNPGFDSNANGWQIGASVFDPANDAAGSATSGSVATNVVVPASTATNAVNQCVPGVIAGTTYNFGGSLLASQLPAGASARVEVAWAPDANCTTFPFVGPNGTDVTTTGSWQVSTGSGVAPVGAVAALVSMVPAGGPSGGTIVINSDDMFFQSNQPVPTLSRASLAVLALALAGAGVVLRRRSLARG